MDAKSAYNSVLAKHEGFKIKECFEYKSIFAFVLEPETAKENAGRRILPMYSVNKTTGEILPFKPIDLPLEEFQSGRIIKVAAGI